MPKNELPDEHYRILDALPETQEIVGDAQIGETCRVSGNVRIGSGTVIENCILRGPVIIGDHCRLTDAYIGSYTTLANRVEISDTEIEHSCVENDVVIHSLAGRIQDSIIGEGSKIIRQTGPSAFFHFQVSENSRIEIV
jgi:glucose-1-phosphate thymidylyltransferase